MATTLPSGSSELHEADESVLTFSHFAKVHSAFPVSELPQLEAQGVTELFRDIEVPLVGSFDAPLVQGFALTLAAGLHRNQFRKGPRRIPYVSHLLAVAAIVLEYGGDEDQAVAALLHDAVEDQGGAATLATIRHIFGDAIADIVAGCSDTDVVPKPPWRQRKERYLVHLGEADPGVRLVAAAEARAGRRSGGGPG